MPTPPRDDCDQPAFAGDVKRIDSQEFTRAGYFLTNRHRGFIDL